MIDQKEFTGPIYDQLEDAYQFTLRHINMGQKLMEFIEQMSMNYLFLQFAR